MSTNVQELFVLATSTTHMWTRGNCTHGDIPFEVEYILSTQHNLYLLRENTRTTVFQGTQQDN